MVEHPAHLAQRRGVSFPVAPAATIGIGGLPHRNARQATEFALDAFDVATIPSLPRRSPAEAPIAQALVGVQGVTLGQYGTVAVDVSRLEPGAPVCTDTRGDQFVGLRTFLDTASQRGHSGPVAWHFTGPISVGVALQRAGASPELAFAVAGAAVRSHLRALSAQIAEALPQATQIVTVDEPAAEAIAARDFPLSVESRIDLLSSAMAAAEPRATVGLHCCRIVDVGVLVQAGPRVLSLPVSTSVVDQAAHVHRFLESGGWIMWGAVATAGPIGVTSNRSWHQLAALWQALAERGCSSHRLRTQCLLSPECGLGAHGVPVAERVCHSLRDISRSVRREIAGSALLGV